MALLRQCLQQLRVKRHEWDAVDDSWPETTPRGVQDSGRVNPIRHSGARVYQRRAMSGISTDASTAWSPSASPA